MNEEMFELIYEKKTIGWRYLSHDYSWVVIIKKDIENKLKEKMKEEITDLAKELNVKVEFKNEK